MFYPNPDFKERYDLEKDCHYSSLVFGADKLFEILKEYYQNENGRIIGIEVDGTTLRVYFKNKEELKGKTESAVKLDDEKFYNA